MSGGQRTLFYLLSFFSPAFGMILGIVCLNDVDFDKKSVGKNGLLIVVLSLVFSFICWFALSAFSLISAHSEYETLLGA